MKVTSRDLRHFINNGKIENIYLFAGPEVGEKKEIISLIEKKLFPNEEPVKYTFYIGDDFDLAEFMNTLNSSLLFSEKKIILLKNIELANSTFIKLFEQHFVPKTVDLSKFENLILSRLKDDEKKKILKIYRKNDEYYLLQEHTTIKDKKLVLELFNSIGFKPYNTDSYLIMLNETNDKIPDGIINLLNSNQHVIFWEMFETQKKDWIRQEVKRYNLYIDDEAIDFILNMIENNKDQLENEISKISMLFLDKKTNQKNVIDRSFFEEYLYHSKIETPFTLYNALLNKNLAKAMDILQTLFITDDVIGLLNGIVWAHRRFIKALDLYENQKLPVNEVFSQLNITIKKNKEEFEAGFKNYTFCHASLIFSYLSDLDYYLKILPYNLQLVKLQSFIINFINGDYKNSFLKGEFQIINI